LLNLNYFPVLLTIQNVLAQLLHYLSKAHTMKNRTVTYFSKNKALKILEHPTQVDLQTLLSATFALSRNRVVKKHIQNTLMQLGSPVYKLTA
jgi:hypothetical protein